MNASAPGPARPSARQPGVDDLSAASIMSAIASKLVGLATRAPLTNIDGVP